MAVMTNDETGSRVIIHKQAILMNFMVEIWERTFRRPQLDVYT